jgi:hypothetical protein
MAKFLLDESDLKTEIEFKEEIKSMYVLKQTYNHLSEVEERTEEIETLMEEILEVVGNPDEEKKKPAPVVKKAEEKKKIVAPPAKKKSGKK